MSGKIILLSAGVVAVAAGLVVMARGLRYDFRDCEVRGFVSVCVPVDRLTGRTAVTFDGEDGATWSAAQRARRDSLARAQRLREREREKPLWTDTLAWFFDSAQQRYMGCPPGTTYAPDQVACVRR